MKPTASEKQRQQAAAGALSMMAKHRSRADHQVKPLLTYLEEHLFDVDLSLTQIQQDCNIRDRAVFTLFHANIGQSLWAYVIDRRLDTAAELLRTTKLKIWQIAHLTGYKNSTTFACAFGKRFHMPPTQYRLRQRGRFPAPELPAANEAEPEASSEDQHQALLRDLRALQARLSGDSPLSAELPITISGEDFERQVAAQIWPVLRRLDRQQQRLLVSEQVRLTTPALFRLLLKKSRSEGRKDRQLGVHFAQLALDSVAGIAEILPAHELANLRAQGWAWIGNAYRLALDFLAAEQAFVRADEELPRTQPNPLVQADLLRRKAGLRWAQCRYEEGLELANAALALLREYGDAQLLAEALVVRSNIVRYVRDVKVAIADLAEAKSHLERSASASTQLTMAVYTSLVDLYTLAGNLEEASTSLTKAQTLAADLKVGPSVLALLQAQQGRIYRDNGRLQEAEDLLVRARVALVAEEELESAAGAAVDLAILYLRQGRRQEAEKVATELLPFLKTYKTDSSALPAGQTLREALASRSITEPLLQQLRASPAEHLIPRI